jgi:hypothetical protein
MISKPLLRQRVDCVTPNMASVALMGGAVAFQGEFRSRNRNFSN